MKKTTRPFQNPAKLIEVYRWMKEFEELYECKPADKELVWAGLASSTSVIRYYYDRLEELRMIRRPKLINIENGKVFTPCRSIILLPLEQANPIIKEFLKKEKQNVRL